MDGKSFAIFRLACEVRRLWIDADWYRRGSIREYSLASNALMKLSGRHVVNGEIL